MSTPEPPSEHGRSADAPAWASGQPARGSQVRPDARYGRYVGLLGLVILALITINTALTKPNGATGIPPGQPLAPFAVPLASGNLNGDANVATHADQGAAGRGAGVHRARAAGPQHLPALRTRDRWCSRCSSTGAPARRILSDMQTLAPSFPGVGFAAVAIKGERSQLRRLVRSRGLTLPVGIDSDGALARALQGGQLPAGELRLPGRRGAEQGAAEPSAAWRRCARGSAELVAGGAGAWMEERRRDGRRAVRSAGARREVAGGAAGAAPARR